MLLCCYVAGDSDAQHLAGSPSVSGMNICTCLPRYVCIAPISSVQDEASVGWGAPEAAPVPAARRVAATWARPVLRSLPSTAISCRTVKYLPLPHPTSATKAPSARPSMNCRTCHTTYLISRRYYLSSLSQQCQHQCQSVLLKCMRRLSQRII